VFYWVLFITLMVPFIYPIGLPVKVVQSDHAAANETSIMMALHPALVHMEHLPRDPAEQPLAIIGKDPRTHASPAHGQKIIAAHLDRMEAVIKGQLAQLAAADARKTS